ncbi:hypothetical protein GGI12_002351 [Dipsacomyces acuminosporus]|nr:hypothetical protein GGI12_002351 [Dipsacomyces acuminosporus]
MSAAPSYTLRYFNIAGLSETIRLLLTAANASWTEENPEWPQEKSKQPFGRLPVLVETSAEGKVDLILCESKVIERYLARTYGFLPADLKLSARQEEIRDLQTDIGMQFFYQSTAKDETKKEQEEKFFSLFDKLIEVLTDKLQSNGNNGHLFGNELSYIDMATYAMFRLFAFDLDKFHEGIGKITTGKLTPEIAKLIATVEQEPALAPHLSKLDKLAALVSK